MGNPEGLATSLASQSIIASQRKETTEALALAEEAYSLATRHGLTALAARIQQILESRRRAAATPRSESSGLASVAHPANDPNRAVRVNLQFIEDLKRWQALPWYKRIRTKKPERPTAI
jgi:hypothetical protein